MLGIMGPEDVFLHGFYLGMRLAALGLEAAGPGPSTRSTDPRPGRSPRSHPSAAEVLQ